MLRRLVAVVTWLLMAHFTFVGSDFACAEHSGDPGVPLAMAHHEHAPPMSKGAATESVPCRTPVVPMCCQALTSCATAFSVTDADRHNHLTADGSVVAERVREMPRSEIIAPDPPPPRV